jgi:hypothetical protein
MFSHRTLVPTQAPGPATRASASTPVGLTMSTDPVAAVDHPPDDRVTAFTSDARPQWSR